MRSARAIAAAVALIGVATTAVAAFTAFPSDSITCELRSTYVRDGQVAVGPPETVRYARPPGAKEIKLGEDVTQNESEGEFRSSAVRIDLTTGAYSWAASGPGWTSATTGQCK